MPSTIGKCKLFRTKHITLLESETFLRNKHNIAFFEIKCTFFGRKENTINLQNTEYIIGHYGLSVKITAQLLTPLTLCALILHVSGGTYRLTSNPNDRLYEKLFHGRYIYSQSFCQKSTERKPPMKYFFSYFVLMPELLDFTSNNTTLRVNAKIVIKRFLKNRSESTLNAPHVHNINTHNISVVRSQVVILTERS